MGVYIEGIGIPTAVQGVRTINIYADGVVTNHAEVTIGNAVPATDVRPVVLCRDCKHYESGWCHRVHNPAQYSKTPDDWFCADGVKREEI